MVRLMRWMIGLMLSSFSTSIKNQYANNKKDRFSAIDADFDYGTAGNHPQMYDELPHNFETQLYTMDHDTAFKKSTQFRHLMETPANESNCIPPSIDSFPPDFFTDEQRRKGGLVVHFIIGIYACYALAAICDTYFVPSLELISEKMGLSSDVAGATIMAAGTSSPELFESLIGSFVTEGDIGVGTIVGSAVFNLLAVCSLCGLLAGKVVPLDWWPLTRDCVYYTLSVVALVIVIVDEKIYWYEATVLFIMFVIYVAMMTFNTRMSAYFHSLSWCNRKDKMAIPTEIKLAETAIAMEISETKQAIDSNGNDVNGHHLNNGNDVNDHRLSIGNGNDVNGHCLSIENGNDVNGHRLSNGNGVQHVSNDVELSDENTDQLSEANSEEDYFSPIKLPEGWIHKILYIITYPVNILFFFTVPNINRPGWKRFFPVTFIMSVIYIGTLSYIVAWMVTIIGYTFGIPDTVMGITFLAIGTSVPEGYSSIIVCKKGMGNMAISNSIGSNVFDILFCLGLPWLIKAAAFSEEGYVKIDSAGMIYLVGFILLSTAILYGVVAFYKFHLNTRVGIVCLVSYSAFLVLGSLLEMNVFGDINEPTCPS